MNLKGLTNVEAVEKTGLTLGELEKIDAWMAREKAREDIRFLKINAVACLPDEDFENKIMEYWQLLDQGAYSLDSLRLGAIMGLQEGFGRGAKCACDVFEVLNNG